VKQEAEIWIKFTKLVAKQTTVVTANL